MAEPTALTTTETTHEPVTAATEPSVKPETQATSTEAPAAPVVAAADTVTAPAEASASASASAPQDLPKEEKVDKDEVKIEAQPIAAGNLGYKAPGLIRQFRFVTKYFWFGDAALDETALSAYLKNEKPEVGHANAAFASQTGEGLLLFAKREDDKGSPAGILNLADATDLSKDGSNDFSFKLHGHKHAFQANSGAERDSWIVAVQKAIDLASPSKEGILGSAGYKSQLDKYSKPATGAAAGSAGGAAAIKSAVTPNKSQDKVHDGTSEAETGTSATAEATPKAEKSRSQSRKRASIFGKVLGKKEETEDTKEVKKEDKKIEKDEKKAEKEEKKEVKALERAEEKKEHKEEKKAEKEEEEEEKAEKHHEKEAAAAAAAATGVEGTTAATPSKSEDPKSTAQEPAPAAAENTPAKSKRGSIFGLSMFGKKEKDPATLRKDEPTAPVKQTEPVADTAPQLDPVDTAVPSEAGPTAPAVATTSMEPADKPTATPSPKADKADSKSGFRGFFNKAREPEAKKDEAPKTGASTTSPTEPATEASSTAVVDSPTDTNTAASPTTTGGLKDRRRSSFFGTITGRKDRKSVEPKDRKPEPASESETAEGDGKISNRLQGLFRKSSKSVKPHSGPATDPLAPPAPPKDTETKAADDTTPAVNDEPTVATSEPTTAAAVQEPTATSATETKTAEPTSEPSMEAPTSTTTAAPMATSA